MIDKEKCNIFSIGLICLKVKFEEIAKIKQEVKVDYNSKLGDVKKVRKWLNRKVDKIIRLNRWYG